MAELQIKTGPDGSSSGIWLIGELDSYSAPRVREILGESLTSDAPHVRLHLSLLEYIDSTGLGVLVGALKQTEDQTGTLELVDPSPQVSRVLQVTGLDKVFTIHRATSAPMPSAPQASL